VPRAPEVIVDVGLGRLWGGIESALAVHRPAQVDVDALLRRKEYGVLCGAAALVLGPRSTDGSPSDRFVERLRRVAPHVGVYVAAGSPSELHPAVELLAWAGADDVLTLSEPSDFRAMALMIRARVKAPPPERELRVAAESIGPHDARAVGLYCLRNGYTRQDVGRIGEWFGAAESRLTPLLHTASLPTAGLVVRTGTHLHARELKRRRIGEQTDVVGRLGFASPDAMRRARARLRAHLCALAEHGKLLLRLLDGPPADPVAE
jgi:hypothetical protein